MGRGRPKYLGVGELYFIPSGSELGAFYIVVYMEKKGWACQCKAFRFSNREDGCCTHVDDAHDERKARMKSSPDKKQRSSAGRVRRKL